MMSLDWPPTVTVQYTYNASYELMPRQINALPAFAPEPGTVLHMICVLGCV
jgi:hypothetical protein